MAPISTQYRPLCSSLVANAAGGKIIVWGKKGIKKLKYVVKNGHLNQARILKQRPCIALHFMGGILEIPIVTKCCIGKAKSGHSSMANGY